MYSYIL